MRSDEYLARKKSAHRPAVRAICLLLVLCSALSWVPPVAAVTIPTGDSMIAQIIETYSASLKKAGRRSFDGYCASYVNNQLVVLGVNKTIIGGNGKDEFDNYKNMRVTSGGYTVHAYPSSSYDIRSALKAITSGCNVVTNILVGFDKTATSSGSVFGHVFLIQAIIDGYIYFSESFRVTVGGVTYPEGAPIKCTVEQLVSRYSTSFYQFDGIIWFEDENLTAACTGGTTSGGDPIIPGIDPDAPAIGGELVPGVYRTNGSSLRVRSGPSTSYEKLATLPYNTLVVVSEVSSNGWGHVFAAGYDGWISLDYAERIGDIPTAVSDVYNSAGTQILREGYYTLSDAVAAASGLGDTFRAVINLTADTKLNADTVIKSGITVNTNGYSVDVSGKKLDIDGGSFVSSKEVPVLDSNPFVSRTESGGNMIYTSTVSITINTARLVVGDNVALGFKASVTGIDTGKNSDVVMVCTEIDGGVHEYKYDSLSGNVYSFTTDGIPAKHMADGITAWVRMRTVIGGVTYERTGTPVTYSPVDYVSAMYGSPASNEKLDAMLAAMLNYGAEAQNYFDYNPSNPANCLLNDSVRKLKWDTSVVVRSDFAPGVTSDSKTKITSARLVFLDTVAIRLNATGGAADKDLKLLVWTAEEYSALKHEADAAGKDIADYLTSDRCSRALDCSEGSFTLTGIPAKQYADTFYFRLCDSTGGKKTYDGVIPYSVTEYCYYKLNDGVDEDLDDLCQALSEYSAAARNYFGYGINGNS